ncbi:hypothetical protein BDV26DRAFT_290555 [Aspergillus bertholletiae]|uniref:Uncharacterized protein n=1 Tax=Aspergillus bertholletiae TaxID=1226010 RepID=A0A5N7BF16_9EURO|nr:hypothetical protein BDV26DRAFT_290555 [Aspergillus bertholletiae]
MSYGKSLAFSQTSFQPPGDEDDHTEEPSSFKRQRRHATVYDAVAGRINARGFLPFIPFASRYRDTTSSNFQPARPEEVLFRRQNAPTRYEENDFYFAHESLPSDRPLPSSDLLEAIHTYSADYYDCATPDRGQDDYKSMDETALLAMGILMEEMAKESLGTTGDLVLVEGEEIGSEEDQSESQPARRVGRKRSNTGRSSILASSADELGTSTRKRMKRTKRPRLVRRASTTDAE